MIDKALYKFFEYIDLFFEKIESLFKRKKK
jgi:hypothetical protein